MTLNIVIGILIYFFVGLLYFIYVAVFKEKVGDDLFEWLQTTGSILIVLCVWPGAFIIRSIITIQKHTKKKRKEKEKTYQEFMKL